MRRARTWSPASARRRRSPRRRGKEAGSDKPSMEKAMPAAFKELDPHLRRAREALPRHAGPRVHGRAGQAVDAADPHRQAHRQGGAAIAVELANEGLITRKEAVTRIDPALARPAAAPDHRSRGRAQGDRHRPAGLAGRGLRRDRVLGRRRRDAQGARQAASSWCGSRPRPRTSTACTPPRASSPRAAA